MIHIRLLVLRIDLLSNLVHSLGSSHFRGLLIFFVSGLFVEDFRLQFLSQMLSFRLEVLAFDVFTSIFHFFDFLVTEFQVFQELIENFVGHLILQILNLLPLFKWQLKYVVVEESSPL